MSHLLIRADARRLPLPDTSVQCIITSPPYWRLRNYGDPRQIGWESYADYQSALMGAFAECWRVLRKDGVLWLQIGDRYASGGRGGGGVFMRERGDRGWEHRASVSGWQSPEPGFKHKDLMGIPWRLALALQAAGWYLRADIIWQKPNAKPESCRDRTTLSHEYLFLLTKSAHYQWDKSAMREPSNESERRRRQAEQKRGLKTLFKLKRDSMPEVNAIGKTGCFRSVEARQRLAQCPTKNRRSVWCITPERGAGGHSATFPVALVDPCILAATKPGDIVLDPFAGTCTSGLVALRHGRHFVGADLNAQYLDAGRARIGGESWLSSRMELPGKPAAVKEQWRTEAPHATLR